MDRTSSLNIHWILHAQEVSFNFLSKCIANLYWICGIPTQEDAEHICGKFWDKLYIKWTILLGKNSFGFESSYFCQIRFFEHPDPDFFFLFWVGSGLFLRVGSGQSYLRNSTYLHTNQLYIRKPLLKIKLRTKNKIDKK